jgi:hypothetical protein
VTQQKQQQEGLAGWSRRLRRLGPPWTPLLLPATACHSRRQAAVAQHNTEQLHACMHPSDHPTSNTRNEQLSKPSTSWKQSKQNGKLNTRQPRLDALCEQPEAVVLAAVTLSACALFRCAVRSSRCHMLKGSRHVSAVTTLWCAAFNRQGWRPLWNVPAGHRLRI